MSAIREVDLDHAFAEALQESDELQEWLLRGGRFRRFAKGARLLASEQHAARKSAMHWWKHWWCRMPDGSESETDVFLVFETCDGRFALHVEDKPPHGTLTLRQASNYRRRAAFKSNDDSWLGYSDFETILLAPADFISTHGECADQFDRAITYEEVARFVPLFAASLEGAIEPRVSNVQP